MPGKCPTYHLSCIPKTRLHLLYADLIPRPRVPSGTSFPSTPATSSPSTVVACPFPVNIISVKQQSPQVGGLWPQAL